MNAPNLHPVFEEILSTFMPPVRSEIENAQIAELADMLASAPAPTAAEIRNGMELAYKMGRIDGSLAVCDRMLKAPI